MGIGVDTALLRSGENWLASRGYQKGQLWARVFCDNVVGKTFYLSKGWRESEIAQEEPTLLKDGISFMECTSRRY